MSIRDRRTAFVAALFGPHGFQRDECSLIVALLLIARGLWLAWRPGAYLVPGLILLWLVLPTRDAFVSRRKD